MLGTVSCDGTLRALSAGTQTGSRGAAGRGQIMNTSDKVNIADYVPHTSEMTEGERHLRSFIGAASVNEPPPTETMKFLTHAFSRILRGKNPKMALKLTQKQGQKGVAKRTQRLNKEMRLIVMVEELRIKRGKTKDEARQTVMNMAGLKDYKTFCYLHKKHKSLARLYVRTDGMTNLKAMKGKK